MEKKVGVGIIGSAFISTIHAESVRALPQAELVGVASARADRARAFAERFGMRHHFDDYRRLLALPEVDMVVIGAPNDLHCPMTLAAAAAASIVMGQCRSLGAPITTMSTSGRASSRR